MTEAERIERAAECAYLRNRDGTTEWVDVPEQVKSDWRAKVAPVVTAYLGGSVVIEREFLQSIYDELESVPGYDDPDDSAYIIYHQIDTLLNPWRAGLTPRPAGIGG